MSDPVPSDPATAAPPASDPPQTEEEKPKKEEKPLPRIFQNMGPQLIACLKEGDFHRSQGLIMGGVELNDNIRDHTSGGDTPLHLAVRKSACGVVKLMIKHKVNVNHVNRSDENSALHIACQLGSSIMVRQLLEAKANPDLVNVNGETPLVVASIYGYGKIIHKLVSGSDGQGVKCNIDLIDRKALKYSNEFELAEDKAAKEGKLQMEVPGWATPRGQRGPGGNNLSMGHSTSSGGHGGRASPRGRSTNRGRSPSPGRYWKDVCEGKIILKRHRRQPQSALLKAIRRNAKLEIVKKLLESGCLPDRQDEKKNTSIHVAAHYGNANTVRMLINAGATCEVKNHLNRTPMHFAARSGHPRILKMLLENKCNINAEDVYGQTPLSVSCDSIIVKWLKDRGGKVNHELEEKIMLEQQQGYNMNGNNSTVNRDVSAPTSPHRSRSPSPNSPRARSPAGGGGRGNNNNYSPEASSRSRSPSPNGVTMPISSSEVTLQSK